MQCAPASIAFSASVWLKWMSAIIGIGDSLDDRPCSATTSSSRGTAHADEVGSGLGDLLDLLHRRLEVGGLGLGHRLHDDGGAAADRHAADEDLALGSHPHRHSDSGNAAEWPYAGGVGSAGRRRAQLEANNTGRPRIDDAPSPRTCGGRPWHCSPIVLALSFGRLCGQPREGPALAPSRSRPERSRARRLPTARSSTTTLRLVSCRGADTGAQGPRGATGPQGVAGTQRDRRSRRNQRYQRRGRRTGCPIPRRGGPRQADHSRRTRFGAQRGTLDGRLDSKDFCAPRRGRERRRYRSSRERASP